MSVWNLVIFSGVAGAVLVSWRQPRFLAWIGALLASYLISVIYWDFRGPYAEFLAGACDLTIVALIAWKARYLWELWVGLMFLASAFVNMVYLANNLIGADVISHTAYSSLLEAINISAIVMMGGISSFQKAGMVDGLAFRPWLHVFGRMRPVDARHHPRA